MPSDRSKELSEIVVNIKPARSKDPGRAEDEVLREFEREMRRVCREFKLEEIVPLDLFIEGGYTENVVFLCDGELYIATILVEEEYKVRFEGVKKLE